MKFKIDNQIFEMFSQLNVGLLVCRGIENKGEAEEIMALIRKREEEIKQQFSREALSQEPKINVWRKVYQVFGVKPKEYKSSVEALYRRALKGDSLRHINKIVDIYNFISLKYMAPVGGEDLDKVEGELQLTVASDSEPPVLLLGDQEAKAPRQGEVIYKDDISAVCRRFNWREADRTKFTEETKNAVVVVEGLPPTSKEDIEAIVAEGKQLITDFCSGQITQFVLNKDKREIEF